MIVMEVCAIFLLANGISSLILALIICVSGSIRTIAMIKNPPSLNFKPIERIMRVVFILCFLAGTTLLPYFGVTEILRGANSECPDRLPTFVAISTDFLIGGKLWLQLLMQIERFAAFLLSTFSPCKVYQTRHYDSLTGSGSNVVAFFITGPHRNQRAPFLWCIH